MQVFVNKPGESTERPASPSLLQKSFNSHSLSALCSTPKASTSVQASSTPTNTTVADYIHDTDNDADHLEDQDSLSEASREANNSANIEAETLHPDNDMGKFSK